MKVRVYQVSHEKRRLGRRCPWSVEWRENGRRQTKTLGSKADAERFATIKRAELVDGSIGIVTRKPWGDFVGEYVTLKVAHFRSAESRTLAVAILRQFTRLARPQWVGGIDAKTLDQYVTKRLAMTSRKSGDPISPETVKKELRTIRAALNVAREWKYLRDVPRMPNPKGYATDKRFVTEEDFDKLMQACDQARLPDPRIHHGTDPAVWWRALLATAWVTGLRHASFQTTQGYIRYAELHQADAYDAHLPLSLQNGEDGAKQRRNGGEESGEPRLRVVAG